MIEINGKRLCENCFSESEGEFCRYCGYNSSVTVSDPTMLKPGSILLGKYIIGKVIGKGGFGVTYLAYDNSTGKKAAIKEYFPYGMALRSAGVTAVSVANMTNADAFKLGAEKFYDEAKLVSRFNGNPNIVGVYEFFYENNTVYFVMEYIQGHTLKEHINSTGKLNAAQALFLIQNVSNALMAAHSSAVLHRDVSPDNIILCDNGDIKLIDFGAARQVAAEHSQSFSVILKPGFAPLEQYQKKGNQGPWTDIYSLGTTLYYAMTGDIPEDPMSRLDDDSLFSSNRHNIDAELWNVISKATQLKIEDRYADIFQLKNDLSKISYSAEQIITPKEQPAEQKPEFPTAVPFGVTQSTPKTGSTPAPSIAQTAYIQPTQQGAQPQQPSKKNNKGLIIGISCGLAACIAAAIIIPNAVKGRDSIPTDGTGTNGYSSTAPNGSSSGTQAPEDDTLPAPGTIAQIPAGRLYYETLNDEYKPLYEVIYDGIMNHRTEIFAPKGLDLGNNLLEQEYYEVLYENPQFCYAYEAEVDVAERKIRPHYENGITPADQLKNAADKMLNSINTADQFEALTAIHDWLCENVTLTARYTDFSTSAHSALVSGYADDLGLSKAFCYCAQRLGFECLVTDGTFNGEKRSWNRICINNTWYNVDVYGDMTSLSYVTTMNVHNANGYIHSFFLTNDDFINASGYVLNSEYSFLSTDHTANYEYPNFYFDAENWAFYYNADDAYKNILDFAVECYNKNSKITTYTISPLIIDPLYEKMKKSFIEDLRQNGISGVHVTVGYNEEDSEFKVTIE